LQSEAHNVESRSLGWLKRSGTFDCHRIVHGSSHCLAQVICALKTTNKTARQANQVPSDDSVHRRTWPRRIAWRWKCWTREQNKQAMSGAQAAGLLSRARLFWRNQSRIVCTTKPRRRSFAMTASSSPSPAMTIQNNFRYLIRLYRRRAGCRWGQVASSTPDFRPLLQILCFLQQSQIQ
jgi:hypothetical protein